MMPTKLEECARDGILEVTNGQPGYTAENFRDASYLVTGTDLINFTRAVIRCLMEPTEEMLFAADWQENGTQDAFRAMLQSVLDEAGKE